MKGPFGSSDLWGTLIKSNPEFKYEQKVLAKRLFGIDEEKFLKRKELVKKENDRLVEDIGLHFNRIKLYEDIFQTTKYGVIDTFIQESDKLFMSLPPIQINELPNIEMVISSNTVLIYGDVLYKVVKRYFGPRVCNFSDEVGVSKPHANMFKFKRGVPVFHIGDNLNTDAYCEKFGISFIHVNEISNLKNL